MGSIDRCLDQVQALRTVAAGAEPAYVARSRLGRLILSVVSLAAERSQLPVPALPGPIHVPGDAATGLTDLAASCNRLVELARHLSQPSEPLDMRWRRGWSELIQELEALELALSHLDS